MVYWECSACNLSEVFSGHLLCVDLFASVVYAYQNANTVSSDEENSADGLYIVAFTHPVWSVDF